MIKVAVTGATGFIGRYVLRALLRHAVDVTVLARNPGRLREFHGLRIVEADLRDADENCFDILGRPDVLIHLAWGWLPNYRSLHHFETELPLHYQFLKLMIEAGLTSVVCIGTCFEYGMQSGPLTEDLPTLPNNPYGYAKDALRRSLQFLQAVRPFNFTWGRLFYLYGEGQASSALYPQLKQAVERGDRVFNMSGGEQLRDYLPVETAADYITALAVKNADLGVVNICSGRPISVRTLVENWLKNCGWAIELNLGHYPYPDYEPMAFWGDRRRLDSILSGNKHADGEPIS